MVEEPNGIFVIDGGQGATLPRFLISRGIRQVDTVIISHADADHFGGISLMLSTADFKVGQVFVNPDIRETRLWADFVSVMRSAKQRGTKFNLELSNVNPGLLSLEGVQFEVLAPSQDIAIRTADGRAPGGEQLTPNAMSAVVRVWGWRYSTPFDRQRYRSSWTRQSSSEQLGHHCRCASLPPSRWSVRTI